jgi:hypothetical protein
MHAAVLQLKQVKDRIDILFANAGVHEFAPLGSVTQAHFFFCPLFRLNDAVLNQSKEVCNQIGYFS